MEIINNDGIVDMLDINDYEADVIQTGLFYFLKFQKDNNLPETIMSNVAKKISNELTEAFIEEEREPDFDAIAKDQRLDREYKEVA